jgi:hypothetical protein
VTPAGRPVIVLVAPVPVVVTVAGMVVNDHVPDDGSPLRSTDPVGVVQVGWVIVPTAGADGPPVAVLITTLADADEIHPRELATVKV